MRRFFSVLLVLAAIGCASTPDKGSLETAEATGATSAPARQGGFVLDFDTWDGGKFSFESIRGKKHLLAAFWATWCDPCKTELRHLAELYPRFRDTVEFVAISTDGEEEMDKVRAFAVENALPFPILVDPAKKKIPSLLPGGDTVPYLLVVDKNGTVFSAHTGYEPGDEERIARELEELSRK